MIVTLEEVKNWLRVDHGEDDTTLTMLIDVSEEYLKESTGIVYDNTKASARLLCMVLITDWYENREFVGKVSDKIRHTVNSILMQLSYGSGSDPV